MLVACTLHCLSPSRLTGHSSSRWACTLCAVNLTWREAYLFPQWFPPQNSENAMTARRRVFPLSHKCIANKGVGCGVTLYILVKYLKMKQQSVMAAIADRARNCGCVVVNRVTMIRRNFRTPLPGNTGAAIVQFQTWADTGRKLEFHRCRVLGRRWEGWNSGLVRMLVLRYLASFYNYVNYEVSGKYRGLLGILWCKWRVVSNGFSSQIHASTNGFWWKRHGRGLQFWGCTWCLCWSGVPNGWKTGNP